MPVYHVSFQLVSVHHATSWLVAVHYFSPLPVRMYCFSSLLVLVHYFTSSRLVPGQITPCSHHFLPPHLLPSMCEETLLHARQLHPLSSSASLLLSPSLQVRGDIARALLYMAVRYDGSLPATFDLELSDEPSQGEASHGMLIG